MKHNGVIQRKFALLDKYLLQLQSSLKDVGFETFRDDWVQQRMTELVHQYEEIDPEILYNLARNQLEDFRRFRDEIGRA